MCIFQTGAEDIVCGVLCGVFIREQPANHVSLMNAKSHVTQDMFQPKPGLISCAGMCVCVCVCVCVCILIVSLYLTGSEKRI